MQRKDAKLTTSGKRAAVFCANASRLGYSKHSASPGDLVVYSYPADSGGTRYGRVVGRIDAPPRRCGAWEPNHDRNKCQYCQHGVKGWLCVVGLSDDTKHHAYERWIDPDWVRNIESVTPGHIKFLMTLLTRDPADLIRMSEYGSLSAYGTCELPPAPPRNHETRE